MVPNWLFQGELNVAGGTLLTVEVSLRSLVVPNWLLRREVRSTWLWPTDC